MRNATVCWVLCAAAAMGQTISVTQLAHRVPPVGIREYRLSKRALRKGDMAQAIAHCEKAIEADPGNPAAHNDLGVLYLSADRPAEAIQELEHSIALDHRSSAPLVHLSYALLSIGKPSGAEAAARRAIDIEPGNHRGRLLLGWALTAQFRFTPEALENLRWAAREYPEAHLAASDVLMHRGAFAEARTEVEKYLDSGCTEDREDAKARLKLLTFEQAP